MKYHRYSTQRSPGDAWLSPFASHALIPLALVLLPPPLSFGFFFARLWSRLATSIFLVHDRALFPLFPSLLPAAYTGQPPLSFPASHPIAPPAPSGGASQSLDRRATSAVHPFNFRSTTKEKSFPGVIIISCLWLQKRRSRGHSSASTPPFPLSSKDFISALA